jgi:hypothetical protein
MPFSEDFPINPKTTPIYQTSVFTFADLNDLETYFEQPGQRYMYSRFSNPNTDELAAEVNKLEGGAGAVVTSSGMSAIFTAVLTYCQAGDHVLCAEEIYGGSSLLLAQELKRLGITVSFVPTEHTYELTPYIQDNTRALLDQLLMNLPAAFIWLAGLVALLFAEWARSYRVIGWMYLAVIGIFLILHGKSYYALGLYPVLLAAGGVAWERLTARGRRVYLKPVLLLLPGLLVVPLLPLLVPVLSPEATAQYCQKYTATGILRWEDGKNHLLPQDYADMLGWAEMAALVRQAYAQVPAAERAQTIIWCDNYGEAGAVNYYNAPYSLPRAHSTEASYALWCPPVINPQTVILVSEEAPAELIPHFQSAQIIGQITNPYAREKGAHVSILRQPDAFVLQRWNAEITAERRKFGLK